MREISLVWNFWKSPWYLIVFTAWVAIIALDSWTTVQGLSMYGIGAEKNQTMRWFAENLGITKGMIAQRLIIIPLVILGSGAIYWFASKVFSHRSAYLLTISFFLVAIMAGIQVVISNFSQLS